MAVLGAYGLVAVIVYGTVMNLWLWPFETGSTSALSCAPCERPRAQRALFPL